MTLALRLRRLQDTWFRPARKETQADRVPAIYLRLVEGARAPWLYSEAGVPDTVTGHFDSLVLHMFIYMQAVKKCDEAVTGPLLQRLFDHMFTDMDRSLREIGVGDLSVGKKIKKMIEGFYGRLGAYTEGFAQAAPEKPQPLEEALRRNLYGSAEPAPEAAQRVAAYVCKAINALSALPDERLRAGDFTF